MSRVGELEAKCPECGATSQTTRSTLPGFARCGHCGKVFPATKAIEKADAEQVDAVTEDDVELGVEFEVPDKIGVEYGWRSWGIRRAKTRAGLTVLQSVSHTTAFWQPRSAMEATCEIGRGRKNGQKAKGGHDVPDERCSCGLYSAKSYEHLMTMPYFRYNADANDLFHVVGKVALWGKVIEGSQGWRSQFGYPASLYLPFEAWHLAEELRESYGVTVLLKNFLKDGKH